MCAQTATILSTVPQRCQRLRIFITTHNSPANPLLSLPPPHSPLYIVNRIAANGTHFPPTDLLHMRLSFGLNHTRTCTIHARSSTHTHTFFVPCWIRRPGPFSRNVTSNHKCTRSARATYFMMISYSYVLCVCSNANIVSTHTDCVCAPSVFPPKSLSSFLFSSVYTLIHGKRRFFYKNRPPTKHPSTLSPQQFSAHRLRYTLDNFSVRTHVCLCASSRVVCGCMCVHWICGAPRHNFTGWVAHRHTILFGCARMVPAQAGWSRKRGGKGSECWEQAVRSGCVVSAHHAFMCVHNGALPAARRALFTKARRDARSLCVHARVCVCVLCASASV